MNRTDPSGTSWKKIKKFFKKASKRIVKFAKRTFGVGSSKVSTSFGAPKTYISAPLPITVQSGVNTTHTLSSSGSSAKPISGYSIIDADDLWGGSSSGYKLNISDFTLNFSFGLSNLGVSGSITHGNNSYSFGQKTNILDLKMGYEYSSSVTKDGETETSYTNASINGMVLVGVIVMAFFHVPVSTSVAPCGV